MEDIRAIDIAEILSTGNVLGREVQTIYVNVALLVKKITAPCANKCSPANEECQTKS